MANEQLVPSGSRILCAFGVWRGKNFAKFARMIFLWWGTLFLHRRKTRKFTARCQNGGKNSIGATVAAAPMCVEFELSARFEQYYFANAESKASFEGSKSTFLQNWAASFAPASRFMPESSHSTERGPV